MEKEIIAGIVLICIGMYMTVKGIRRLLGYLTVMAGFYLIIEGYSKYQKGKREDEEEIIKEYMEKYGKDM